MLIAAGTRSLFPVVTSTTLSGELRNYSFFLPFVSPLDRRRLSYGRVKSDNDNDLPPLLYTPSVFCRLTTISSQQI
jgi:hypothetical protein